MNKVSERVYMKVKFDPMSVNHIREYQSFLKTRSWKKGCRFLLEWPYASVPDMISSKLIDKHLKTILEKVA